MKLIATLLAALMLVSTALAEEHPEPADKKPIKVGITLSMGSAQGLSPSGQKWGYDKQLRITGEFENAGY